MRLHVECKRRVCIGRAVQLSLQEPRLTKSRGSTSVLNSPRGPRLIIFFSGERSNRKGESCASLMGRFFQINEFSKSKGIFN